jgi:hypothetical protein
MRDETLVSERKLMKSSDKLPTYDDKVVFTDDDDTYRKHKYPTVVGVW